MNQLDSFKIASLHATANVINEQDAKQLTTKFSTAGRTVGAKGKKLIKKMKTKGMKSDSNETSSQLLDDDVRSGGPGSGRHASESAHRELTKQGFRHQSTEIVPGKSHEEIKPGTDRYKAAKISTYTKGSQTKLVHEDGSIHNNMSELNKHLEDMHDDSSYKSMSSKAMTTVTPGPMYSNNLRAMIDQDIAAIHAGSKMSGYYGHKLTTKAKGGTPAHKKQHSELTAKGYSHIKTVRTSNGPYSIYSHPKEGRLMVSRDGKITNIKAKKVS